MITCPNCQTKCKDFDINTVNIKDFKLIQKLANDTNIGFGDLGRIVHALLYSEEAVQE